MRVASYPRALVGEPRMQLFREQNLAMLLQPGFIEVGLRRSEMTRFTYAAGEIAFPAVKWKNGFALIM